MISFLLPRLAENNFLRVYIYIIMIGPISQSRVRGSQHGYEPQQQQSPPRVGASVFNPLPSNTVALLSEEADKLRNKLSAPNLPAQQKNVLRMRLTEIEEQIKNMATVTKQPSNARGTKARKDEQHLRDMQRQQSETYIREARRTTQRRNKSRCVIQ